MPEVDLTKDGPTKKKIKSEDCSITVSYRSLLVNKTIFLALFAVTGKIHIIYIHLTNKCLH